MISPTADTTLTVRVPRSWVGRVTAGYVRESISRYLANRIELPKYQGALDARVSWRLPEEDLQQISLEGDRGDMVRRIVAAELRSTAEFAQAVQPPVPVQPARDSDIVSEELVGEDPRGGVIILQRDSCGFGYLRSIPISRENYLRSRRV